MHCTNCHRKKHNVKTYRFKRKEDLVPVISKVIIQHIKVQKPMRYFCHICGDTKHKIIYYLKYNDMQNMFRNKRVKPIDK